MLFHIVSDKAQALVKQVSQLGWAFEQSPQEKATDRPRSEGLGHGVAWHGPRPGPAEGSSESVGMGQALPGSPHLPEATARDCSPLPIRHRCPFREGRAAETEGTPRLQGGQGHSEESVIGGRSLYWLR